MPRVPEHLRPNWLPLPPTQASVSHPPWNQGDGNTHLRVGGGGVDSDDWRESLALCILCVWKENRLLFYLYGLLYENFWSNKTKEKYLELSASALRQHKKILYVEVLKLPSMGSGTYSAVVSTVL